MMAWLFAVVMTGIGAMLEPSGAQAAPICLDMTPDQVVALLESLTAKLFWRAKFCET